MGYPTLTIQGVVSSRYSPTSNYDQRLNPLFSRGTPNTVFASIICMILTNAYPGATRTCTPSLSSSYSYTYSPLVSTPARPVLVQCGSMTNNIIPVFSTLRVYALSGQNKVLALITLFFSLGPLYANAVRSIHYMHAPSLMSASVSGPLRLGKT